MIKQLAISTPGQGLHEVTTQVAAIVRQAKVDEGLCTLFIRHTSASLVVQENADPTAKQDLERWVMAYSAGLGETDPRYYDTTAASGPWVHPLFPVCYEWPVSRTLRSLPPLEAHKARLIHAQHDLVLHRPLRADETLQTFARIAMAAPRAPGAFV